MSTVIKIDHLSKKFKVEERMPGFMGAVRGFFHPKMHEISAVEDLSFEIKKGERVAFIGPNGAGKSTTIKMLTGTLFPSSGKIEILGLIPWEQRTSLGYHIGTIFGQRSQLWYHLPAIDTFNLLSKIYEIDSNTYKSRLKDLISLFEVQDLVYKPVRQLSLGERMRCELVGCLLHQPKILFLDEPTIGLDINGKLLIRELLNKLSNEQGTTLFLTSHDPSDIEQVCERVLVLDKGKLIIDSPLRALKKMYMKKKIVNLVTEEKKLSLNFPGVKIIENDHYQFTCEVDIEKITLDKVIQEASKLTTLKDITIEDPSMEEVIRILYRTKKDG